MITERRWAVLAVLALVQFVIVTDTTIVNVALPTIGGDLHLDRAGLSWVVNGYLLAAGGLLLLGGRLADLLGRRRMFLVGAACFGLASVGCAVAPDGPGLIMARAFQGVGEALASPAALSIIVLIFPSPEDRARALGIWGGLAGLGATLGVTLSGVLVTGLGWRSIFWINVPFVLAALVLLPRLLRSAPSDPLTGLRGQRVDFGGAITVTAGMTALVHGLVAAQDRGLAAPEVWAPAVGGLLLVGTCGLIGTRHPYPLVPPRFFADRTRVAANVASALVVGPMASMFLMLTLYQQQTLGRSALQTGLAYLPFCVVFVAGVFASVALVDRLGPARTTTVAFAVAGAGMLLLLRVDPAGGFWGQLLPATLVLAVGFGLALPPLQSAAMHGLSETDVGLGAGVQTAVQSLGAALGVAVAFVLAGRLTLGAGEAAATRAAFAGSAVALGLGLVLSLTVLRAGAPVAPEPLERQPVSSR